MIHGQMLRVGERLYGDETTGMQYSFLRAEPEKPSCDRHPDIDAQVQTQMKANAADEFASMFGVASEADVRASLMAAQQQCDEKYQFYDKAMKHMEAHPSIRTYRKVETTFFGIFKLGSENQTVILLIMVLLHKLPLLSQTYLRNYIYHPNGDNLCKSSHYIDYICLYYF